MFHRGQRHGEGTQLFSAGARYEGEWMNDAKHGDGVFVFEDGSVWSGRWERDAPVVLEGGPPFAPESTRPRIYAEDLLDDEADREASERGAVEGLRFGVGG